MGNLTSRKLKGWIRTVLGSLLALHMSLSQASMVHAAADLVAAEMSHVAQIAAVTPHCHDMGAAPLPQSTDMHSQHNGSCCSPGHCHCAAGCYLAVRIGVPEGERSAGSSLPAFSEHSIPPPQLERELKPPILR
jgi:hypothetical protein